MVRKFYYSVLMFFFAAAAVLLVFADEYDVHKVFGSWKLDRVYEYASSESPKELVPEEAASLFAEAKNIYTFLSDNNVFIARINDSVESYSMLGSWEEKENEFTVQYDNGGESLYYFDSEQGRLHRYWKETDAEAMYHDLDFVYTRVPAGMWMLEHVVSTEDGRDSVILDPESAASLYAEKNNLYYMNDDWSASVTVGAENEAFPVDDPDGRWLIDGEKYLFEVDGYEMEFVYDEETNKLHRYWTDDNADAMYHDLDFVYSRVGVR